MKAKNAIFICSITENSLKVIKCLEHNKSKSDFLGLETEVITPDADDKKLSEKIKQIFKKLDYKLNPVIISLPRSHATCRYLKIPASSLEEIGNIAYLQASRYLPYSADELITAFQKISTDKAGFAHVNLIIVHKDTVGRYLKIFKELKTPKINVVLSSYGLVSLYNYIKPNESGTVMLIELDYQQAELVIISSKRLIFSRSFKLSRANPNWENLLIDQVNKTQDAFFKEVSQDAQVPQNIVFVGAEKALQEFPATLTKQMNLPVEVLSLSQQINFSDDVSSKTLNLEDSYASLIGLGLGQIEDSLNLLPQDAKREFKNITQRKRSLNIIFFLSVIILLLGLGIAKDLDNRAMYLERLKKEVNKIADDAKSLEDIEKRFALLERHLGQRKTSLDILYELHQIIPSSISLVNLTYEEGRHISLRGQTPDLNSVLAFVEQLEKSAVFKDFNVKVRYATGKKTQSGEIVDFEIGCLKRSLTNP